MKVSSLGKAFLAERGQDFNFSINTIRKQKQRISHIFLEIENIEKHGEEKFGELKVDSHQLSRNQH